MYYLEIVIEYVFTSHCSHLFSTFASHIHHLEVQLLGGGESSFMGVDQIEDLLLIDGFVLHWGCYDSYDKIPCEQQRALWNWAW